ncbi:hypothetical protein GGI43DRAFT_412145 [Trichoderma evansii]
MRNQIIFLSTIIITYHSSTLVAHVQGLGAKVEVRIVEGDLIVLEKIKYYIENTGIYITNRMKHASILIDAAQH